MKCSIDELIKENEQLKEGNQKLKAILATNFIVSHLSSVIAQAEKHLTKASEVLLNIGNKLYSERQTESIKIKELKEEIRCLREGNRISKILKYQDIRKAVEKARERQFIKDSAKYLSIIAEIKNKNN